MRETVELAKQLLQIPSHDDETAVGEFIFDWCSTVPGAEVQQDNIGNIIAKKGSGETTIALVGHHDVVPPGPDQITTDNEYVLEEDSERIHCRGSADMKGSLAAAMCAFKDCDPDATVIFTSFVGEEVGGVGAQHAIENGFKPDYAIIGEGSTSYSKPGITDVVIAHRGRREHTFTATGTAMHASESQDDKNAIYNALPVLNGLKEAPSYSDSFYGQLIEGSLVATKISDADNPSNTLPHTCTITADERTIPDGTITEADLTDVPYDEWESSVEFPPMVCDEDYFGELVREAATTVQDEQSSLVSKPHATDAGWLAKNGTICVVCGAAEPGEAHTNSESVRKHVLERCKRIYQESVEQL